MIGPSPDDLPRPTPPPVPATAPRRERVVLDRAPPMRARTHVRATVALLLVGVLILGVAYPLAVTGIAQLLNPKGADGSLITSPNGTVIGSEYVGQNTSLPSLFWDRISLTDYNTTQGAADFYGPSDPALAAWLNATIHYLQVDWNLSLNESLPLDLVSPSLSSTDPFLVPAGVLIQVPRVALAIANLTHTPLPAVTGELLTLVNAAIQPAIYGVFGTTVVNVPMLDVTVLETFGIGGY